MKINFANLHEEMRIAVNLKARLRDPKQAKPNVSVTKMKTNERKCVKFILVKRKTGRH